MKIIAIILLLFSISSCDFSNQRKKLEQRELELNQREQALIAKENELKLKEEELLNRQKLLDSTASEAVIDTAAVVHPTVAGNWNVTMNCTETTCPGSAVGDTKNEHWQISFEGAGVVTRAFSNGRLVRVYTGVFRGNVLELSTQQIDATGPTTKMVVRIQETKENEMEGQRQIIRGTECRIIYDLILKKE